MNNINFKMKIKKSLKWKIYIKNFCFTQIMLKLLTKQVMIKMNVKINLLKI